VEALVFIPHALIAWKAGLPQRYQYWVENSYNGLVLVKKQQ